MKRIWHALLWGILCALSTYSSSVCAQQYRLSRRKIPKADYSGICHLGGNQYAVVSDNEIQAGFYVWTLCVDSITGKLTDLRNEGFRGVPWKTDCDAEDIVYCQQRGTVFVSGETDQRVLEHRIDGTLTGAELKIPQDYSAECIQPNRGFEALGYDAHRDCFWTCTESSLKGDTTLRLDLLSFGSSLFVEAVYPYVLDAPQAKNHGRDYYHGVVAITPLPDGRLLILEREARIAPHYVGSRCWCKLFVFDLSLRSKTLLKKWDTCFKLCNTRFSNYEGMCLGPVLQDGTPLLLLLCDSQSGAGRGPWRLKDRLMVIPLDNLP